jgi:hypothetical protein
MRQYQIIEMSTFCTESRGEIAVSTLRNSKSEDFCSGLEWKLVDLFQGVPDVVAATGHLKIVGPTQDDGPVIWVFVFLVCSVVSWKGNKKRFMKKIHISRDHIKA